MGVPGFGRSALQGQPVPAEVVEAESVLGTGLDDLPPTGTSEGVGLQVPHVPVGVPVPVGAAELLRVESLSVADSA